MNRFILIDKSCYRRREEVSLVRRFFLANDWQETDQLPEANLAVFFACAGLRFLVDEKLAEIVATRERMKPGAELIIGSCLPGMAGEQLRTVFEGKTITPTDFTALNNLPSIRVRTDALHAIWGRDTASLQLRRPGFLAAARMWLDDTALEGRRLVARFCPVPLFPRKAFLPKRRNTVAFSIVAGCSRRCTYCAKPFASGTVRSKPIEVVVRNVSEGLRLGYRRFDFLADSIGVFGLDLNVTLGDLLDCILSMKQRFSVGLFDLHPQDFLRYFTSVKSLCLASKLHYLHVPVQSGNERVLKLMNRPCNVADLAAKLADIRRSKHVFMQSGMVAGFPGETDEEFADTIRLLKQIDFDDVYVHYYCDMPNTAASRLDGRVAPDAMRRRLAWVLSSGIRHNLAATRREWDRNLAYHECPARPAPGSTLKTGPPPVVVAPTASRPSGSRSS
jgi:tRNA A37 methylthiotransferase MiaB